MSVKSLLLEKDRPSGQRRWRVAKKLKRVLLNWYYRRKYGWGQCLSQHLPNVYHPGKFNRFLRRSQATPFSWSPEDAEQGVLPAARVVLGIWQSRPDVRRQFPRPLQPGESALSRPGSQPRANSASVFRIRALEHLQAALDRRAWPQPPCVFTISTPSSATFFLWP